MKLVHNQFRQTIRELYQRLTWLDKKPHNKGRQIERKAVADAIHRVKLNFALIKFLEERRLIRDFKSWYDEQTAQEEKVCND